MLATFIEDRITVYEPEPLAAALRAACLALPDVGRDPGDQAITIFMAQIALETGRGRACHDFNFGNVKATDDYRGFFTCFRCNEILHDGKVHWFSPDTDGFSVPPGHPQTRFRAYKELGPAALEFMAFLGRASSRYHAAWLSALAGDAVGYVHNLKARGYFTANEDRYRAGVVSLCATYAPAVRASYDLPHEPLTADHQIDDNTTHSPMTDEDLEERVRMLQIVDPDWDAMRDERNEATKDGI